MSEQYDGIKDSIQYLLDYVEKKNHEDLNEEVAQHASYVQTWLVNNEEKLP